MNQADLIKIELSTLSCYANNEDCFEGVEHLISDLLFTGVNRTLYNLIKANYGNKLQSDLVLIHTQLKAFNIEREIILDITKALSSHASISNVPKYVMLLFENYCKNTLLPVLNYSQERLLSQGDIFDEIDNIKTAINTIEFQLHNVSKEKDIKDIVDETIAEIEEDCKSDAEALGQPTGLPALDKISGGLSNEVIVIGGTPGTGKTALLINLIYENALKKQNIVLFFSLEMTSIQVVKRIFSHALDINSKNINRGNLLGEDLQKIRDFKHRIKSNLMIDETSGITWQYVEAKVRKLRKNIPIDQLIIVMIDYVQLMRNTPDEERGKTKEDSVATRVNNLARMAKQYNLCMIELSQFSRDVTKRAIPRPMMSDIKESGAIENNAHQVWLMWRPDMYDSNPTDEKGNSIKGLVEIIIAKNREGSRGHVYSRFLGEYSKYLPHIENAQISESNEMPF